MNWSEITLKTLRENPADAEMESHRLLVRAGYIKKVAPGIFTYSFLFLRSLRKMERILREELARANGHEILMPVVQPAGLWQESRRWPKMTELLKFKNKNDQDFCLGATHEEVVVDFIRRDIKSYRDLPSLVYQIQTKYRDEIRPRYGLMRCREFIMKDAYSFDRDREKALLSYEKMKKTYTSIFKRLGVEFITVQADSGSIGGELSSEFQVVANQGMDQILLCECGYGANLEVVPLDKEGSKVETPNSRETATSLNKEQPEQTEGTNPRTNTVTDPSPPMEKFSTPGLGSIKDLEKSLNIPASRLVKTFFVKFQDQKKTGKQACLLLPGDRDVNFVKVKNLLKSPSEVEPLSDEEVSKLTGARPGSCGPVGLKIPVLMDQALKALDSFIVGANEDDYHLKNVLPHRDFGRHQKILIGDISQARPGDPCPECGKSLTLKRGIEVGHIFYLGTRYSEPMGLRYLDENGKTKNVEMGCYGIGVTRSLQAVVEQSHDDDGICWPLSLSPFGIHICLLDPEEGIVNSWLGDYQKELEKKGFDLFVDDRKERPGIKFKDADLLGFPLRVTVGKRGFENKEVELFIRKSRQRIKVPLDQAFPKTLNILGTVF